MSAALVLEESWLRWNLPIGKFHVCCSLTQQTWNCVSMFAGNMETQILVNEQQTCSFQVRFEKSGITNVLLDGERLAEAVWSRSNVLLRIVRTSQERSFDAAKVQVPLPLQLIKRWADFHFGKEKDPATLCAILKVHGAPWTMHRASCDGAHHQSA
jgi:hypothetical protein